MRTLLGIPDEILVYILSYTDVTELLSLRKTCRQLYHLSKERAIWEVIYYNQTHLHPMPYSTDSEAQIIALQTGYIEALVISIHRAANAWVRPRHSPQPIAIDDGFVSILTVRPIQDMHMLLHRWLLVVYQEGSYELWDLSPSDDDPPDAGLSRRGTWGRNTSKPLCVLRENIQGACLSSAACVDPRDESIVFAVAKQPVTKVVRINVKTKNIVSQNLATVITSPFSMHMIRAINPISEVIVYSFALTLHFLHWPTRSYWKVVLEEDQDEIYNVILSAHFMTPQHLVCLKNRAIEVLTLHFLSEVVNIAMATSLLGTVLGHTLYARGQRHVNHLQYFLPDKSMNLRGAVFSDPIAVQHHNSTSVGVTLLAFDVLRGLFHYSIEARFIHTGESLSPTFSLEASVPQPLDMNVSLLAAHLMAQLANNGDTFGGSTPTPRSGFTPGSRGFISACSLGDQGKRGIWVERHRTNMRRSIFGFSTIDHCSREPEELLSLFQGSQQSTPDKAIQGRCMHELKNSYDLRDDITHCALSEVTGNIVLGTRRGQVLLL